MSDLRKIYQFDLEAEGLGLLQFIVLADSLGEAEGMIVGGLKDALGTVLCGASGPAPKEDSLKLMVVGHARHGKDTVGELLRDNYGLAFTSSSMAASKDVVFPVLGPQCGYKDHVDCYNDRSNHRREWFDIISDFSRRNPAELSRIIYKDNDVYCGIRNAKEFHATKNAGLFDWSIFVDAGERLPPEKSASMELEPWMCDFVLDNNGSLADLHRNLDSLMASLLRKWQR